MAGCLPIFIQIPVFFSLYKVQLVAIEMRHAPFFGWIKDLSAPDPTTIFNLFGLIPWTPPAFLMLGILPLLMGISMWVQMRLSPQTTDPVQQQVFAWMPVVFTFMLARIPGGPGALLDLEQHPVLHPAGLHHEAAGGRDRHPAQCRHQDGAWQGAASPLALEEQRQKQHAGRVRPLCQPEGVRPPQPSPQGERGRAAALFLA